MNPAKSRILHLKHFLETYTDENYPATMPDMLAYLQGQGIPASRKTVTLDIEQLMEAGMDVVCNTGRRYEYFIGVRHFELPELKLLADAVQASKFIPAKKSKALIEKLTALTSVHHAREMSRQLYVQQQVKTGNVRSYITVDLLHTAINASMQVAFKYCEYDQHKRKVYKHNRYTYVFSPYALLWNSDKYYTVGYSEKHGRIAVFRVDRIASPKLLDAPAVPMPADFDIQFYTKSVFQMYDGASPQNVTLQCENSLMNNIIDRFGEGVETVILDDGHFIAMVELSASPAFFGWVFSFGGRMKITAPPCLVEEYQALARKATE